MTLELEALKVTTIEGIEYDSISWNNIRYNPNRHSLPCCMGLVIMKRIRLDYWKEGVQYTVHLSTNNVKRVRDIYMKDAMRLIIKEL